MLGVFGVRQPKPSTASHGLGQINQPRPTMPYALPVQKATDS